ncbi:MAG: maltose ABC transporter substrate-binding protein [Ruminococcus sp.]|nr:maltose ABC transporter substrate-binding protein [Ruminococcus sp.]
MKMDILKRTLMALTALSCGVSMTACGGKDDKQSSNSAAEQSGTASMTDEEITLTVWESVDGPDRWIKQAGEAFTKQYPNIRIEFVNVEMNDASAAIAMDGPAGTGPDLFAAPHDKLGELVVGGHVLKTANEKLVKDEALPTCVDALTYDGILYGYPSASETYALYYNKALISEEEIPETWDELIDWCKTFNAKNTDKYGFVMNVASGYYAIIFTTANGNRLFGKDGTDISSSYLATEDSIRGMEVFQKLRTILPVAASDMGSDTADGAFLAGKAAMNISGPWNVANCKEAGLDFGVATLPGFADDQPSASFSGTRAMFVSAYSEYPTETAKFAEFLMSEEMQELRYQITGALPAIDCDLSGEYAEYSEGFLEQLEYAFPMPSVPQMAAFWEASDSAVSNIWNGADVKTELDALDKTIVGYVSE